MDNTTTSFNSKPRLEQFNLREVDDLQEWWSQHYQQVWKAYEEQRQTEFYPCYKCFGKNRMKKNNVFQSYEYNLKSGKNKWRYKKGAENKVRFIELAASNICNQMCVMCSGRHSNQWFKYDADFMHDKSTLFRFTDDDYNKIVKLIPDLDVMVVKGGDCFADQKHIDLMEKCSELNPDCNIRITTNLQGLRKSHLNMLSKLKHLDVMVSVDGTHELYNWIRGGDFDRVTKNMQMFYDATGLKIGITITITVYNYFSLESIFEYFYHKEYINWIQCHNLVTFPWWCSIQYLPDDIVEKQLEKYLRLGSEYGRRTTFRDFFDPMSHYKANEYKDWLHNLWLYTDKMNKIRGFNVLDYTPELKNLLQDL
jgi:MoaA/NifB/PqqE/SkfB family radical SAM enzyme